MSSSANRRPRVAGQRRRPERPSGSQADSPVEPLDGTQPPADAPTPDLPHRQGRDHDTDGPVAPVQGDGLADADADADADTQAVADEATADADEDAAVAPTTGRRRLLVPALALALSLALLAAVLVVTRNDPEERPRAANAATATARSTLEQILSYNHATMTQQIPANQELLTGSFKDEFAETMTRTIVPLAQKDKTVVKARAYEVGVMSQTDDTVTVQAFVNQARTSDAQEEPSIDQNRVIATMTRVGNRWLVSALRAY